MNLLKKIWNILINPNLRFIFLARHGFYDHQSDKKYLTQMFSARMHQKMDWDNPVTYMIEILFILLWVTRFK